jgi:hypothetical protein
VAEIMAQGWDGALGRCLARVDLLKPTQHGVWGVRVTGDARYTSPKASSIAGSLVAIL